jgi:hypothetical protein
MSREAKLNYLSFKKGVDKRTVFAVVKWEKKWSVGAFPETTTFPLSLRLDVEGMWEWVG